MIHTLYSNSYEVLRTVLLHNIEALRLVPEADEMDAAALFSRVFDRVPVIIPSKAVETDLQRALAHHEGVCAAMDFMFLSQWLGFFSKEPLANVVGNESDWMIWALLRETGPGSLREEVRPHTTRLEDALRGRTDAEIFALAQRISAVFVTYSSYRLDWVLQWLGLHQERIQPTPDVLAERARMESDPDLFWQRALWRRLAESKRWRGRRFLEALPDAIESLRSAGADARELVLGDDRRVALPNALHVFMPFVVPPLMLPVLKAYAHSGRDVWLYLLNPSSEYWFDLVPRRLFNWRESAGDEHFDVGHPILADNGRSTRANIDRLWRFTTDEGPAGGLTPQGLEEGEAAECLRRRNEKPRERVVMPAPDFLREYQEHPRDLKVEMTVDAQSIYLEAGEPALLRRVQDSILKLEGDLTATPGGELVREDDESLRFVCAPSTVRELEGLADWLHARFRRDPALAPDDVLVVTPDISAAAPLIDQVFGSLPKERRIDYRISGALTTAEDAPLEALMGLKSLLTGRLKREELVAWLSLPLVSRRFGLEADDVDVLNEWLRAAGFEFGLSDAHLLALDPETFAQVRESTLERALERLALGSMLPGGARAPLFDVLPREGTESSGFTPVSERPDLLSTLSTLCVELEAMRRAALDPLEGEAAEAVAADPQHWPRWIARALEMFFPPETPQEDWQALRAGAAALAEESSFADGAGGRTPVVPFEIFMTVLADRLKKSAPAGRPGSGVTFTGMQQLRGLPYKVIVVFGLNADSRFPGTSHAEEFDLMARFPRRGDRDGRVDNRNVFLDLLLAARDTFLISYSGGFNPAQMEDPSIVAVELRNWLLSFAKDRDERRLWEKRLTVRLPLAGFSPRAFRREAGDWQSTAGELLPALAEAQRRGWSDAEPPLADRGGEAPAAGDVVPLTLVMSWLKDPARFLLKRRGVFLEGEQADDRPPCVPEASGLPAWSRGTEALSELLEGGDGRWVLERWAADPTVGAKGVREWAVAGDVEKAEAIAGLVKDATQGLVREDPVILTAAPTGVDWSLTVREANLWRDPATGLRRFVFAGVSKIGKEALSTIVVQALFEYALVAAAGIEAEGVLICPFKPAKRGSKEGPNRLDLPAFTPGEGRRILGVLARSFAASLTDAPALAKAPYAAQRGAPGAAVNHANLMLFRGLDLKGALEKLNDAAQILTALLRARERAGEAAAALFKPKGRKKTDAAADPAAVANAAADAEAEEKKRLIEEWEAWWK